MDREPFDTLCIAPQKKYNCTRPQKCRYFDTLPQDGSCDFYHMENEHGWASIRAYSVFPGIWLAFQEAYAYSFENHTGWRDDLLEIAHCQEGRLEYEDADRFFYLGEGDMSIHRSSKDGALLHCPVQRYRGLSVIIHPELAPACTSCLLGDVDVKLSSLWKKFCAGNDHFIMRSTPQLEYVFSQLYQVPESIRKGYYKVKVLELLLFLSCLDPAASQQKGRACTPAQVQLARSVISYVDTHRSQRLTAQQLGKKLHATSEQLRGSIQRVYGKPLYQCIRGYKMRVAAKLLVETDRTIMDIAGEFGYDNSSKFAGAFREVLGVSPREYRMRNALDGMELHFGAKKP